MPSPLLPAVPVAEVLTDVVVEKTRQLAVDASDPSLPVPGVFRYGDAHEEALTTALRTVSWVAAPTEHDPELLRASLALVQALPLLGVLPHPNVPPELGWAPLRVFFSGLGYRYWAPVAEAVTELRSDCPWDAPETEDEWRKEAEDARRTCGWPLTLPRLRWKPLVSAVLRGPEPVPMDWMRLCTAWHILRHLRWSDVYGLVAAWGGAIAAFDPPKGVSVVATATSVNGLATALEIPPAGTLKKQHALGVYARTFLTRAPRSVLLRRRPLPQLPGRVLAGPWSAPRPLVDPTTRGWGHDLSVADVYVADAGRVLPVRDLDAESVLSYDWLPHPPDEAVLQERGRWRQSLVSVYETTRWPTEILCEAFPNLRHLGDAHLSLVDAVFLASVIRAEEPRLTYEFPFLLLLAGDPGAERSTNNGKTACTQAIVQALQPGAPVLVMPRNPGAPDRRVIWQTFAQYGTIGIDEWSVPLDDTHILNRESLQALCVGRAISFGLVLDNRPHLARLSSSLVANAKAIRLPPDIVNRSVFLWVDPLTDDQRANAHAYEDVLSGRLSLRLRLAALAAIEATRPELPDAAATTVAGSRFGVHRALAAHVFRTKTGCSMDEAYAAVDAAHAAQGKEYQAHTAAAATSGLLAELASGPALNAFHVEEIFDAIPTNLIPSIADAVDKEQRRAKGVTVTELLLGLTSYERMRDPSYSVAQALGRLVGSDAVSSLRPRAVARRVLADLLRVMPNAGDRWALPGDAGLAGWHLHYTGVHDGHHLYRLVHPVTAAKPV